MWRTDLYGLGSAPDDRQEASDLAADTIPSPGFAFLDAHALLPMPEHIRPTAQWVHRDVVVPLARGVRAVADGDSAQAVAREFGVGWACARQCVIDDGDTLIAADGRLDTTSKVGVDEHTFQHANAKRRTQMATTFVDIDRARLLDVVRGRSGQVARDWIGQQPSGWIDQIEVATIDAFRGYATAIDDVLPDALLVMARIQACVRS